MRESISLLTTRRDRQLVATCPLLAAWSIDLSVRCSISRTRSLNLRLSATKSRATASNSFFRTPMSNTFLADPLQIRHWSQKGLLPVLGLPGSVFDSFAVSFRDALGLHTPRGSWVRLLLFLEDLVRRRPTVDVWAQWFPAVFLVVPELKDIRRALEIDGLPTNSPFLSSESNPQFSFFRRHVFPFLPGYPVALIEDSPFSTSEHR